MTYRWLGAVLFTLPSFLLLFIYEHHELSFMGWVLLGIAACAGFFLGNHYEQIRLLAYQDSLTGTLVNRRFVEMLEKEIKTAKRLNYQVTLLFIDLDNFKNYNDKYGHLAGDQILRKFAELLKQNVRKNDVVGRWGGEEFVVLLPQADTQQGMRIGERIRSSVRTELNGVTVSIGLATFPHHAENAMELAMVADTCMYEAKKKKDCLLTVM